MNRSVIKPYIQAIEELGAEVVSTEATRGQHFKYTISKGGKRRFFIGAATTKSFHAVDNFKSHVRKWLREIGELE